MMIVTIDGPAGAGKSTVARQLAERLGFEFLDTGAMYRMVTWAAMREGIDLADSAVLAELAMRLELKMSQGQFWVGSEEVTEAIRRDEVTRNVRCIADPPAIRRVLVERQRQVVGDRDFVTEGRDQGTVVFPDAACKVFLTATAETRAKRRWEQLGEEFAGTWQDVLADQNRRDAEDCGREFGGLKQAGDAIEVATDDQTLGEVVERLVDLVRLAQESENAMGGG